MSDATAADRAETRRVPTPRWRTRSRAWLAMALAIGLLGTGGCARSRETRTTALRVFAAASLTGPLEEIARSFESAHPGHAVELHFAGSQQLAAQLEHGAIADVFIPADTRWMTEVRERRGFAAEVPSIARSRLVLVTPASDPARVSSIGDLGRHGVRLVIAADAVPAGRYAREAIHRLRRVDGFGDEFAVRALANVVSEEENVKAVLARVRLGEADAGFVYASDVTLAASGEVRVHELPRAAQVWADFPAGVLDDSRQPEAARRFLGALTAPDAASTFARHGFDAAETRR